jgi:hypothetical protein
LITFLDETLPLSCVAALAVAVVIAAAGVRLGGDFLKQRTATGAFSRRPLEPRIPLVAGGEFARSTPGRTSWPGKSKNCCC